MVLCLVQDISMVAVALRGADSETTKIIGFLGAMNYCCESRISRRSMAWCTLVSCSVYRRVTYRLYVWALHAGNLHLTH